MIDTSNKTRSILLVVVMSAIIGGLFTGSVAAADTQQSTILESDTTVVVSDGYPDAPPTYPDEPTLDVQTVLMNSSWTAANVSVTNPSGSVMTDQTPGETNLYSVDLSGLSTTKTYTVTTDAGESFDVDINPDATAKAAQTSKIDNDKIETADSILVRVDTESLDTDTALTYDTDGNPDTVGITVERYVNDTGGTMFTTQTVEINTTDNNETVNMVNVNDIANAGYGGITTDYSGDVNKSSFVVPDYVTDVTVVNDGKSTTILGNSLVDDDDGDTQIAAPTDDGNSGFIGLVVVLGIIGYAAMRD